MVGGLWSSILTSAKSHDEKIFRAFTASITDGKVSNLYFEENGYLAQNIEAALALVAEKPLEPDNSIQPKTASVAVARKPKPLPRVVDPKRVGTGSGFVVSDAGHILTNEHVVNGCSMLKVDGKALRVLASDKGFDLALLQGSAEDGAAVAQFASAPAPLNSDLTVLGYPLQSLLGGLNVTRGTLSSLKGMQGDATEMQITAPIQPGNSGGPVVDSSGAVIGVVVAKLKPGQNADGSLDLRQNVNFAIRGEIAKLFLAQNGVTPQVAAVAEKLEPVALAARAAPFTKLVECYK
nr:serine protease [Lentibacter algarum]